MQSCTRMNNSAALWGTDFGKEGPILAAKIGPAGPILAAKVVRGGPILAGFSFWQVFLHRSGRTDFGVTGVSFGDFEVRCFWLLEIFPQD